MQIKIVKIGKLADQNYSPLAAKFEKRLRAFTKVESVFLKAFEDESRQVKELSGKLDLNPKKGEFGKSVSIALDERGKLLSSPDLAMKIKSYQDDPSIKQLSFIIGGPFGLPQSVRKQVDLVWSLSPAVVPSDLAWLIVWEQIYRAFSINAGSSYHHE